MKCAIFMCAFAALASGSQVEVTPVQKVIQLLSGMLEKGKKEKHEEEVMYAAAKIFCQENEVSTVLSIKEETGQIQGLEALIAKNSADASHLMKLIQTLDKDEDIWSGDIKAATKVREIEKADYDKTHASYSQSISATQRAVAVLKKQAFDRKQAPSFAQISSLSDMKMFPDSAKKTLNVFLQQDEQVGIDEMEMGAPEANAAEFQSQGVVEMLEKLTDKFIEERTTIEKEEANAKHAYQMLMQGLKSEITQAVKDKHHKQLSRSKRLADEADEKGDLKQTQTVKITDESYLKKLTATCTMKAEDFKARQELRAGEIAAIEKAIEVLSSGAVAGNAEKHLPSLLQKKATSFGQLRSATSTELQLQMKARLSTFMEVKAREANSRVLAMVAQRIAADPFGKVKKMIKDLVVKLMEEANEEADHKGWCDTELSTNEQTRKEKTELVETLHSDIDGLEASIAKLTDAVNELSKTIAASDSAVAKATKLRNEEKAKNTATMADAQAAQTAVAQALTVLREFYAKAAEPETGGGYNGMQESNGGVIGMLEVIESDFARLESETSAAEGTASKEYKEYVQDAKVDKAAKSTTQEHKSAKLQDETQALTVKKADLEGSQKELNAALTYYDKLKPSCVDAGVSYEDRVNRRKEEIQSMQEGLKILNGEDIA